MNKPATTRTRGAVLYTRVSTGEQDKHGTSPESQRDACRAKALALSLPIIAEYYDGGISGGFLLTRAGMQAALADIKAGRADTLICANLSRYSRDVEHQQAIKKAVQAAGGHLVFCDMDFADTPEGDLNFTIQGGFAEYERKVIRKRTMGGRRRKAEQGIQTAMRAPYGYHLPTKADILRGLYPAELYGKYVQVPEKAAVALRMFTGYDAGKTLHQIRRELQAEGIPTILGGPEWGMTTIARILRNPVYKGAPLSGAVEAYTDETRLGERSPLTGIHYVTPRSTRPAPEGRWLTLTAPPVVDEALWDRVQQRLEANKSRRGGNPGHARMLSGRVFCPLCGAKMGPVYWKTPEGEKRESYSCTRYQKSFGKGGERQCSYRRYRIADIEAATATAILEACQRPASIAEAFRAYKRREAAKAGSPTPRAADARRELVKLDAALKAIQQDEAAAVQAQIAGIRAGASPDAYADAFAEIAARRKDLLDRRGVLKAAEQSAEREGARPRTGGASAGADGAGLERELLAAALRVLTSPEISGARKRDIIATIVEKVVCQPDGAHVSFLPQLFGGALGGDTFHCIEVTGIVGDVIGLQDLFRWDTAQSALRATGLRPACAAGLEEQGFSLPSEMFQ